MSRATGLIEVDCSAITFVDEATIGLLVVLSRAAKQRGVVVRLEGVTPALLVRLTSADVIDRFDVRQ